MQLERTSGDGTLQTEVQGLADILRHCTFMLRQVCQMLHREVSEKKLKVSQPGQHCLC